MSKGCKYRDWLCLFRVEVMGIFVGYLYPIMSVKNFSLTSRSYPSKKYWARYFNKMKEQFCDNCGRGKNPITSEQLRLKEVILRDESGTALYCDDCRANNPNRKEVKNDKERNK